LTTREETLLTFPVEEFAEIMEEFLDMSLQIPRPAE
jgi:hypothetical protein